MHIRRAHEDEALALSGIAYKSKSHWQYSAEQLAAWSEDLTVSPDEISSLPTYVAEVESVVVGFFMLVPSSLHWNLEHFWVLPSSMGHGLGRALLAYAAALAAEGGATALAIDADPNAELFYLACGAQRVGSQPAPVEDLPNRERPQLLLHAKPA